MYSGNDVAKLYEASDAFSVGAAPSPAPPAAFAAREHESSTYRILGAPPGLKPCAIYSRDKPPFGGMANAGGAAQAQEVPVRIHDQCITSEVFRSQR